MVNVVGSSIAKEVTTYSIPGQVRRSPWPPPRPILPSWGWLYLVGLYFADVLGSLGPSRYDELVAKLLLLPSCLEQVLDQKENIQYLCLPLRSTMSPSSSSAGNIDYAMGLEGSLKLKEISYILRGLRRR